MQFSISGLHFKFFSRGFRFWRLKRTTLCCRGTWDRGKETEKGLKGWGIRTHGKPSDTKTVTIFSVQHIAGGFLSFWSKQPEQGWNSDRLSVYRVDLNFSVRLFFVIPICVKDAAEKTLISVSFSSISLIVKVDPKHVFMSDCTSSRWSCWRLSRCTWTWGISSQQVICHYDKQDRWYTSCSCFFCPRFLSSRLAALSPRSNQPKWNQKIVSRCF